MRAPVPSRERQQKGGFQLNKNFAVPENIFPRFSQPGVDATVLLTSIFMTVAVTGGYRPDPFNWVLLAAVATVIHALTLFSVPQKSQGNSPIVSGVIRSHLVISVALAVLVVSTRVAYPFASHPDALNNQLHSVLRGIACLVSVTSIAFAAVTLLVSSFARVCPVFWLTIALNLTLISTTVVSYR